MASFVYFVCFVVISFKTARLKNNHETHKTHERDLVPAEGRAGFFPCFMRGYELFHSGDFSYSGPFRPHQRFMPGHPDLPIFTAIAAERLPDRATDLSFCPEMPSSSRVRSVEKTFSWELTL